MCSPFFSLMVARNSRTAARTRAGEWLPRHRRQPAPLMLVCRAGAHDSRYAAASGFVTLQRVCATIQSVQHEAIRCQRQHNIEPPTGVPESLDQQPAALVRFGSQQQRHRLGLQVARHRRTKAGSKIAKLYGSSIVEVAGRFSTADAASCMLRKYAG